MKEGVVFWNVDTQKDFMLKKGKLYIGGAEVIINNLITLTQLATEQSLKVINTADYHTFKTKEISDKPDFINTFPEHCMAGTEGMDFIDETNPTVDRDYCIISYRDNEILDAGVINKRRNIVIHKDAFDVFAGNPHTKGILDIVRPKTVVVYGVATDVCVDFAVKGLLKRGLIVIVVEDAIKGLSDEMCKISLENWEKEGALLATTEELKRTIENNIEKL